jgi:hypothetical protein
MIRRPGGTHSRRGGQSLIQQMSPAPLGDAYQRSSHTFKEKHARILDSQDIPTIMPFRQLHGNLAGFVALESIHRVHFSDKPKLSASKANPSPWNSVPKQEHLTRVRCSSCGTSWRRIQVTGLFP